MIVLLKIQKQGIIKNEAKLTHALSRKKIYPSNVLFEKFSNV